MISLFEGFMSGNFLCGDTDTWRRLCFSCIYYCRLLHRWPNAKWPPLQRLCCIFIVSTPAFSLITEWAASTVCVTNNCKYSAGRRVTKTITYWINKWVLQYVTNGPWQFACVPRTSSRARSVHLLFAELILILSLKKDYERSANWGCVTLYYMKCVQFDIMWRSVNGTTVDLISYCQVKNVISPLCTELWRAVTKERSTEYDG